MQRGSHESVFGMQGLLLMDSVLGQAPRLK